MKVAVNLMHFQLSSGTSPCGSYRETGASGAVFILPSVARGPSATPALQISMENDPLQAIHGARSLA